MRLTIRAGGLAVAVLGFVTPHASAQICGVAVDCDWAVPQVAYYDFNSASGDTAFDVINGNNGIWAGDVGSNVWTEGFIGGGSQTNDENGGNGSEHYDVASMPQLNGATAMSISLWFRTDVDSNNNSTYNGLFMTRNTMESSFGGGSENWGIALESNGDPRWIDWRLDGAAGPDGGADEALRLINGGNVSDRWYHVVTTWDGTDQGDGFGERALFIDGVEIDRIDAPMGSITASGLWEIGNDDCCGNREFTGTMDELAVWNTALSATDVAQINAAGLLGVPIDKEQPPVPGDVDLDGDVDGDDWTIIKGAFLTNVNDRTEGDLTSDGFVDWRDYRQWKDNFPFTPSAGAASFVPEPASVGLGLLACFALAPCRRHGA